MMKFFSTIPQQPRRRRSTETNNDHSSAQANQDDSMRRRRRSTGDTSRQSLESPPVLTKKFMVLPLRLRDIDSDNPTCLICHEDYELGCTISYLPCGHLYHDHCINDWLQHNSTCCVCRYELPTADINEVEDIHDYHTRLSFDMPGQQCLHKNNPLAKTIHETYIVP